MQLKLLFIALLFSLTYFPPLAFGQATATSTPWRQAPVQFRNDIFNPYWWLAIPTAFTNDIFNPIWYMKVASHFTNDIFNKGLWWSGYEPPQFIFPQPTPAPKPRPTREATPPALDISPSYTDPPAREESREPDCFIEPGVGRVCPK